MDDSQWLSDAIELAHWCPPSDTAFSVGAIVVVADQAVATGYSRRDDPVNHAEEAALSGFDSSRAAQATMYCSLEPCGNRASRQRSCAELIIAAGIRRVVYAWGEPDVFVEATGKAKLVAAGIEVVVISELADSAAAPNAHLLG